MDSAGMGGPEDFARWARMLSQLVDLDTRQRQANADIERKRLDNEAESKRFDVEVQKKKIDADAEVAKKKIDAELEMRRMDAEVEKRRLDVEMEKIKLERERFLRACGCASAGNEMAGQGVDVDAAERGASAVSCAVVKQTSTSLCVCESPEPLSDDIVHVGYESPDSLPAKQY
eukprot:Opistho-2@50604